MLTQGVISWTGCAPQWSQWSRGKPRTRENEVQMIPGMIKWMSHKWDFTVRIRSDSVWSVLAVCLMWSALGQFRPQMQLIAKHFEFTVSPIGSKSTSINFTGRVVRIFFLVSIWMFLQLQTLSSLRVDVTFFLFVIWCLCHISGNTLI